MAHSLALRVKGTYCLSSAHRAPIKAPMLVPPTMSMGMPSSVMALIIPTCARPLWRGDQGCDIQSKCKNSGKRLNLEIYYLRKFAVYICHFISAALQVMKI